MGLDSLKAGRDFYSEKVETSYAVLLFGKLKPTGQLYTG